MTSSESKPARSATRVLLTGGTGFVGGHLRAALRSHEIVLLGRKEPADLTDNERWSYMDMADQVAPEDLGEGEVLCHLAYSMTDGRENVVHNRRLLDAANARPEIKQVILLSSTSVYGPTVGWLVDEQTPCNPAGEYARTKLECEALWREGLREGCSLVVLRPSEIVGPGGRGLLSLIRDALDRPFAGSVKRGVLYHRRLHYVAVRNVVAAVLFGLDRQLATQREVYVVSDDHQPENESYATMQDAVRNILGKPPLPSLAVPRPVLWAVGEIISRPLGSARVYSSQKIRDAGFVDAVPLIDEVRSLVRSLGR